jgi:uncharacterized protein YukE
MTEAFYLDPRGLADATGKLGRLGDGLGTAYDKLAAVLDEHDGCWGADSTGKAFGQNYTPNEQKLRDAARQAAGGVADAVTTTNQAAAQLESVDAASAARLDASYGE